MINKLDFGQMEQKAKILAIVGKSGSGKTTAAEYIEQIYSIPMIQSYTDREPRHEGENGHIFVTKEEFDIFKHEDMIAFTNFGDNRYCCLKKDVKPVNTYVIDETGLLMLTQKFNNQYIINSVFIDSDYAIREDRLTNIFRDSVEAFTRLKRDKGKFNMFETDTHIYDYILNNNSDIHSFNYDLDTIVQRFFLSENNESEK